MKNFLYILLGEIKYTNFFEEDFNKNGILSPKHFS